MPFSGNIMPKFAELHGPLVAVLVYDGLCTFEFGIAYEVFGLPRPEMAPGWYRYVACGVEPGPLRAAGGLTVNPDAGPAALRRADLIVVPGWRSIDAPVPQRLVTALRAAHRRGARIMSLCSGIAVIAACGLLDGRRATTHWRYVRAIAARHPKIRLEPDLLYVDEGQVLTAAGSAAGIDLCLHVVRSDFGAEAANMVARRLVVPPHRDGGQAQFVPRPVPREREAGRLGPLLDWMRHTIGRDHTVEALARRAGMSSRTFQRRFRETTGLPPVEWLITERVRRAQECLEAERPAPLGDIAVACGFGSLETMRRHFRLRTGLPPASYRRRFSPPTSSGP